MEGNQVSTKGDTTKPNKKEEAYASSFELVLLV